MSVLGPSFRIMDWICYHGTHSYQILKQGNLQEYFRLCDCSSLCFYCASSLKMTSHDRHVVLNTGDSTVCLKAYTDPHQNASKSTLLAFCGGLHRWPAISPHKGPVMQNKVHLMTLSWCMAVHTWYFRNIVLNVISVSLAWRREILWWFFCRLYMFKYINTEVLLLMLLSNNPVYT